ncbi:MAG: hypothetical protein K8E24_000150 [Methanobacterium paludis]|nr:hypothetical protein [Methanobacterium paludis]
MVEQEGTRINVYLNQENKKIVDEGRKMGIKPSQALIQGYCVLLGNTATYNILQEEKKELLKRIKEIETQMDELNK